MPICLFFTILPGEKRNPHLTRGIWPFLKRTTNPYFLNLKKSEVPHRLILGATGSGKFYVCSFIVQNSHKYKPLTYVLIKTNE